MSILSDWVPILINATILLFMLIFYFYRRGWVELAAALLGVSAMVMLPLVFALGQEFNLSWDVRHSASNPWDLAHGWSFPIIRYLVFFSAILAGGAVILRTVGLGTRVSNRRFHSFREPTTRTVLTVGHSSRTQPQDRPRCCL